MGCGSTIDCSKAIAAGASDMMSHILESYFDQEEAFVPDAISARGFCGLSFTMRR